jgi:hypothetical protein
VSLLPAVEVPVPSLAVEFQGPPPTAEVAESSSVRVSLMGKEMMDLATCRYINFHGVGVIDLEGPQLPEKEYKVVAERRFNELTIMETIASVSKALHEYELCLSHCNRRGGCGPSGARGSRGADSKCAPPPQVNEGREASPP